MKLAEIAGGRSGSCGEAEAELLRASFFVTALSFSEVHFFVAGVSPVFVIFLLKNFFSLILN